MSATSPEFANTFSEIAEHWNGSRGAPLPDDEVEWIFKRFALVFGKRFSDLWAGIPKNEMRSHWAKKLAGYRNLPDVIVSAVEATEERMTPPNLPEFLEACHRAARIRSVPRKLCPPESVRTLERETARMRLAEIRAGLGKSAPDPLDWARYPKTLEALEAVREGAKTSERLRGILDELAERGVCDANGRPVPGAFAE